MSAPTRDELAELRSLTVSTVNDALRLLNFKDSLLDYIAALEAQNRKLEELVADLSADAGIQAQLDAFNMLEAQNKQLQEALTRARNGACGCHSSDNTWHMGGCWKLKVIEALAATEPKEKA